MKLSTKSVFDVIPDEAEPSEHEVIGQSLSIAVAEISRSNTAMAALISQAITKALLAVESKQPAPEKPL